MIEHVFKHARVAILGHPLEFVGEIAVIAVGSHRNACGHLRVEIGRINSPLLARVATKKLFVEQPADLTHDHVLGCAQCGARFRKCFQEFARLCFAQITIVNAVYRIEIDRHREKFAIDARADAMLVSAPGGKARQVFKYFARVCMKDVRPIFVHEQSCGVGLIISISANVFATVADQHRLPGPACKPLGQYATSKSGADDEVIVRLHQAASVSRSRLRASASSTWRSSSLTIDSHELRATICRPRSIACRSCCAARRTH